MNIIEQKGYELVDLVSSGQIKAEEVLTAFAAHKDEVTAGFHASERVPEAAFR